MTITQLLVLVDGLQRLDGVLIDLLELLKDGLGGLLQVFVRAL